jgi:hypothetical protein
MAGCVGKLAVTIPAFSHFSKSGHHFVSKTFQRVIENLRFALHPCILGIRLRVPTRIFHDQLLPAVDRIQRKFDV